MPTVGIRELRQRASELLRLVRRGETVQITDRGHPVAILAPIPTTSRIDQLIAEGRLVPAADPDMKFTMPKPAKPGLPPASEILQELREERL